jgi:hypothetical protein
MLCICEMIHIIGIMTYLDGHTFRQPAQQRDAIVLRPSAGG